VVREKSRIVKGTGEKDTNGGPPEGVRGRVAVSKGPRDPQEQKEGGTVTMKKGHRKGRGKGKRLRGRASRTLNYREVGRLKKKRGK